MYLQRCTISFPCPSLSPCPPSLYFSCLSPFLSLSTSQILGSTLCGIWSPDLSQPSCFGVLEVRWQQPWCQKNPSNHVFIYSCIRDNLGPWGYSNPQERQDLYFHGDYILGGGESQQTKKEEYKEIVIMRRVVTKLNQDDGIGSNRGNRGLFQFGWRRKGLFEEVTFKFRPEQARSSSANTWGNLVPGRGDDQ